MQISSKDKVLIVGAAGLLGSHLVRTLTAQGVRPRCLVRATSNRSAIAPLVPEDEIRACDVRDAASLEPHFEGVNVCFHVSGTVDMGRPRAELEELIVGGGKNVLDACSRHGVRKVVVVSTGETIGACERADDACDESRPFDPRNAELYFGGPYHRLETLVGEHTKNGLDACMVNLLYVMDAADKTGLFNRILRGKRAPYIAGGISLAWIDDIMAAMLAAAARGRTGERYMLAGENVTWQDMFERIRQRGGRPGGTLRVPTWLARTVEKLHLGPPALREMLAYAGTYLYYDCSKARAELDYRITPLDQIIDKVLAAREGVAAAPQGAVA